MDLKRLFEGAVKHSLEDYVANLCSGGDENCECDGDISLDPNDHAECCPARKYLEKEGYGDIKEETLVDQIFAALENIPEFNNLSMDRQGEISMHVEKMIKNVSEEKMFESSSDNIKKEYDILKKLSTKEVRDIAAKNYKIVDKTGWDKQGAISDILRNKYGNKAVAAFFGLKETSVTIKNSTMSDNYHIEKYLPGVFYVEDAEGGDETGPFKTREEAQKECDRRNKKGLKESDLSISINDISPTKTAIQDAKKIKKMMDAGKSYKDSFAEVTKFRTKTGEYEIKVVNALKSMGVNVKHSVEEENEKPAWLSNYSTKDIPKPKKLKLVSMNDGTWAIQTLIGIEKARFKSKDIAQKKLNDYNDGKIDITDLSK